jgi:hypothetical protein
VIDNLDLPFEIKFSNIEKLEMKVPWKTIAKDPIEITLSNIVVVLKAQD